MQSEWLGRTAESRFKEHLHEVSKALWPYQPDQAWLWADVRCDEMDDGCLDAVQAVLRSHASDCDKAAGCADYIEHNRERMQYAAFRAQGLSVASGVVESGSWHASQALRDALDGPRCQRHRPLRCCILSGLYEDFCAYRTNCS